MADPRDFLLNTDYEMDKIILFKTGDIPRDALDVAVPHGLSFTPLIFGICSGDPNFAENFSIPCDNIGNSRDIQFYAWADETNIYLSYTGNQSTSPNKFYYRIYGFEPTNVKAHVASTSNYANNFILNTDYNYCKLKSAGIVDATYYATTTIPHNLNYLPQVMAWYDLAGGINPYAESGRMDNISVDEQNVYIYNYSYPDLKVHYRIYYDEA